MAEPLVSSWACTAHGAGRSATGLSTGN